MKVVEAQQVMDLVIIYKLPQHNVIRELLTEAAMLLS